MDKDWIRMLQETPLATVHTRPMDVALMSSNPGQELIRYEIRPEGVVGLSSGDGQFYVLLSGRLRIEAGSASGTVLGPGEVLTPGALADGLMVRALELTTLLEITSSARWLSPLGG